MIFSNSNSSIYKSENLIPNAGTAYKPTAEAHGTTYTALRPKSQIGPKTIARSIKYPSRISKHSDS